MTVLATLDPHSIPVLVFAAMIGAIIGSFLTLITHRLPQLMKAGLVRSQCPNCQGKLDVRDLWPIFSWAYWRGKCRMCRSTISVRYPLTELACALGAVLVVATYGITWEALAIVGLWWCIVAIILTDLEHYIILDEVQIATALFGVLYCWTHHVEWSQPAIAAVIGVVAGLLLKFGFIAAVKKDGLGMGDVKFLGVAGIWLMQAENFVPFLFFSGILGIITGLLWRWLSGHERFPFGPALAFALLLCVVVPEVPNGFWKVYGVVR